MEALPTFAIFMMLAGATLASRELRRAFIGRETREWIADTTGLVIQGVLVPILKIFLISQVWPLVIPEWKGAWSLSFPLAFLLNFTVIDYLYYWNHRLLHSPALWKWHCVHHSSRRLDFAVTSRNSIVSHFMFIYLWALSLFGFLLQDPMGLWWGAAASAGLDLWRHSGGTTPAFLRTSLGRMFVLPEDHEWHHSRETTDVNFGANLKIWDRLHGTVFVSRERCEKLGVTVGGGWRDWLISPKEY